MCPPIQSVLSHQSVFLFNICLAKMYIFTHMIHLFLGKHIIKQGDDKLCSKRATAVVPSY